MLYRFEPWRRLSRGQIYNPGRASARIFRVGLIKRWFADYPKFANFLLKFADFLKNCQFSVKFANFYWIHSYASFLDKICLFSFWGIPMYILNFNDISPLSRNHFFQPFLQFPTFLPIFFLFSILSIIHPISFSPMLPFIQCCGAGAAGGSNPGSRLRLQLTQIVGNYPNNLNNSCRFVYIHILILI